MLPSAWIGAVLVLAAYRLTRLVGWDEFPLAARVRAWAIGETWVRQDKDPADDLGLPGKQPASQAEGVRPAYDRPTLAHLVHCPFCVGWWISLTVYLAWLADGRWTLYACAPLALSGAVGLLAKNLDP